MCDETCVNCGNDQGPHHLCSDCLADVQPDKDLADADEQFGAEDVGE